MTGESWSLDMIVGSIEDDSSLLARRNVLMVSLDIIKAASLYVYEGHCKIYFRKER